MLSKLLPLGANRRIAIIQIAYFYSVFVKQQFICLTYLLSAHPFSANGLGRLGKKNHFRSLIAWRLHPRNS